MSAARPVRHPVRPGSPMTAGSSRTVARRIRRHKSEAPAGSAGPSVTKLAPGDNQGRHKPSSSAGKSGKSGKKPSTNDTQTDIDVYCNAPRKAASANDDMLNCGSDCDNTCSGCLNTICKTDPYLKCDICASMIHVECTLVPAEIRGTLVQCVSVIGYVCDECRHSMKTAQHRLHSSINAITEELAKLRTEVEQLREMKDNTGSQGPAKLQAETHKVNANVTQNEIASVDAVSVASVVNKQLMFHERRKRNVIVSGLPERPDVDDCTAFLDLCQSYLSSKPYVTANACLRLGKKQPGVTRRLLVRLASETTASEILASAKQLRYCGDESVSKVVYINPDLSPEAAKIEFEKRQKRRDEAVKKRSTQHNIPKQQSDAAPVDDDGGSLSAQTEEQQGQPAQADNTGSGAFQHNQQHSQQRNPFLDEKISSTVYRLMHGVL